jgi:hypothetical protein
MGYPSGNNTHSGTGMGKHFYPQPGMGIVSGIFFCRGCGYGKTIPGGYVPVAISTPASEKTTAEYVLSSSGSPSRHLP